MMHTADVRRIRVEADHASVMLGWAMIVLITASGFAALAYAIGKYAGMTAGCR